MERLKIKVCGMKYPENIAELGKLPIDYMGLIFYPKSLRYADQLNLQDVDTLPQHIRRVGVFVNANFDCIVEKINKYNLDMVQLHGSESFSFCKELNQKIPVIKAFNISEPSDFEQTKNYEGVCDYFLFDTKTPHHGGSGLKFDWDILNAYTGNMPFFLSGGISIDDAEKIKRMQHPLLYGIDLNSKFEIEPGFKNIELLKQFIKTLNHEQN